MKKLLIAVFIYLGMVTSVFANVVERTTWAEIEQSMIKSDFDKATRKLNVLAGTTEGKELARVNYYLGQIAVYARDFENAKKYMNKAYELDSEVTFANPEKYNNFVSMIIEQKTPQSNTAIQHKQESRKVEPAPQSESHFFRNFLIIIVGMLSIAALIYGFSVFFTKQKETANMQNKIKDFKAMLTEGLQEIKDVISELTATNAKFEQLMFLTEIDSALAKQYGVEGISANIKDEKEVLAEMLDLHFKIKNKVDRYLSQMDNTNYSKYYEEYQQIIQEYGQKQIPSILANLQQNVEALMTAVEGKVELIKRDLGV